MLLKAYAAVAALASTAMAVIHDDHNILTGSLPMFVGRIDPIVNPGEVSAHVHTVIGASNFRSYLNTPKVQQEAACTSASVTEDKSNYWHPTMYYIHDNGTFEAMLPYTRIYYFQRNDTATEPWPQGLRVVSGEAMVRNASAFKSHGISMHCDHLEETPDHTLPQGDKYPMCKGATLNIHFPSCGWANRSLDSWDHFSHLTWARDGAGGIDVRGLHCPESHPIHYPAVMLNSVYYFDEVDGKKWRAGKDNWIMSNGDLVGQSFHADFVMGWNADVIKGMTDKCSYPHSARENLPNCAPVAPYVNMDAAKQCAFQGQVPAEDIGLLRAIDKLPGCNPVWTKDMGPNKPTCENPPPSPGFATPNVYYGQGWDWHIPIWAPDIPDITSWIPDMDWPGWVGRWGVRETSKAGQAWPSNPDTVMKAADGQAFQPGSLTYPIDKVFGMSDETPFNTYAHGEEFNPGSVVTPSQSAAPSASASAPFPDGNSNLVVDSNVNGTSSALGGGASSAGVAPSDAASSGAGGSVDAPDASATGSASSPDSSASASSPDSSASASSGDASSSAAASGASSASSPTSTSGKTCRRKKARRSRGPSRPRARPRREQ